MSVEIGLGFQSDKSPEAYARLARQAEGLGFDVLSVFSDLLYQPPIYPLLIMARNTERVRLGPACLNPYSLAPFEIAGQVAALDRASRGRAYLGLARGAWLDAVGIAQPRPARTIREAAEVVAHLLRHDPAGYEGEVFRLAPGTVLRYDVERPDPPLMIGTWGPVTAGVAGEMAGEVKIGGTANPAMVPLVRGFVASGAARAGRDGDEVGIVVGAVTVVDSDGDAARARARVEVAMYLAVVAGLDPTVDVPADLIDAVRQRVDAGAHEEAGRLIPDDVLDLFCFWGTPGKVAAQAAALIDAGARRIEFGTPHGLTDERGVELLGTEVLPLLRERR